MLCLRISTGRKYIWCAVWHHLLDFIKLEKANNYFVINEITPLRNMHHGYLHTNGTLRLDCFIHVWMHVVSILDVDVAGELSQYAVRLQNPHSACLWRVMWRWGENRPLLVSKVCIMRAIASFHPPHWVVTRLEIGSDKGVRRAALHC